MSAGYWHKFSTTRLSRRRGLALGATALGASALTWACGGAGSETQDATSLVTQPKDETKSLKRGGTLVSRTTSEPNSLEPHLFPGNFTAQQTYSGLWLIKDGYNTYTKGEIEGDVVESWEFSPDKLTLTAKINPNAHFAPVAPVNGRAVEAQDVVATFQRHKNVSNQRAEFANDINPQAPVVSVTATDSRTVVIKLNEPNAAITALLARGTPGSMFVVPKESLDPNVLNLARTSAGSGPWYISEHNFGIGHRFKRNPGFKQDKRELPYIDEINWPTVAEYAAFLAQFRAGSIHLATGIRAQDVLPAKKDIPELEIIPTYFSTRIQRVGFGVASDSAFRDERLRQAWMMTIDRDLYLDAVYNLSNYRDAGLPVEVAWESGLQADSYEGWLLNARDEKEFGPNSRFFKFNIAEARKLVEAAGQKIPMEADLHLPARQSVRNVSYWDGLEPLFGMTADSGVFKVNVNLLANYDADWVPKYHNQSLGPFSGVTISLSSLAQDPATYLHSYYNSKGALRQGSDSTLDDLTTKMVREFDNKKRMELGHDIQRYEGQKMYYPRIGGATGFSVGWPAVRNRDVYRGGTMRGFTTIWLDQEKAPFKRA
jgi:ABC-type transport system substrate-binding protein